MNAPFYKFGYFGDELYLIAAFTIGIGFGFFLERAGFGSAKKLTAQFYFVDMAVFKVMFSAIVTAMLGLFYLSWLGIVDIALVFVNPTYLLPQIVGGLLLGVGFIVGGYCPGTSLVALSTGRIDAVAFLTGIVAGIFAFGEAYPAIEGFANSTALGTVTLHEALGVDMGVVVFAVVLMAVLGFWGASAVERRMAHKAGAAI
jgi:uncharacterized protein